MKIEEILFLRDEAAEQLLQQINPANVQMVLARLAITHHTPSSHPVGNTQPRAHGDCTFSDGAYTLSWNRRFRYVFLTFSMTSYRLRALREKAA